MPRKTSKPKNFDNLLKSNISAVESISGKDRKNISIIHDYLSEYLKSFVLLGYDTTGESVVVIAGKTAQDYDAIETLLKRVSNIDFFKEIQEEK
jgi:hypothetical protein|tara:strand:+ start:442 stop:723 length:282 start_codon:yes stop_codon:yes gene_type:complete